MAEDNEAGLTPEQVEHFRQRLLEERSKLVGAARKATEYRDDGEERFSEEMDEASHNEAEASRVALAGHREELITEIDAALGRVEDGTYGLCEGTDEQISIKRLEVLPWTRYSAAYAEQLERETGRR